MISSGQFAKESITTSGNSFADTFSAASSTYALTDFSKNDTQSWEGDNVSGSAFGTEDIFGGTDNTFGSGIFGGYSHFLQRDSYTPSH